MEKLTLVGLDFSECLMQFFYHAQIETGDTQRFQLSPQGIAYAEVLEVNLVILSLECRGIAGSLDQGHIFMF